MLRKVRIFLYFASGNDGAQGYMVIMTKMDVVLPQHTSTYKAVRAVCPDDNVSDEDLTAGKNY